MSMERELFQDLSPMERVQALEANAVCKEQKTFMKPYTPEQLHDHKEALTEIALQMREIEDEFKEVKEQFKARLKPLQEQYSRKLNNIRSKAQIVTEDCYKMVDEIERTTGFYSREGLLVEERRATLDEIQPQMFNMDGEARMAM